MALARAGPPSMHAADARAGLRISVCCAGTVGPAHPHPSRVPTT